MSGDGCSAGRYYIEFVSLRPGVTVSHGNFLLPKKFQRFFGRCWQEMIGLTVVRAVAPCILARTAKTLL